MTVTTNFYSLSAKDSKLELQPFSEYKGKVVLIVNVASKCKYTSQYQGLEALNKKYKDDGLVVLGFPCNQFGGQEPGSNDEIVSFCKSKGVSFKIMEKVDVNGTKLHAVYEWLKSQEMEGSAASDDLKWNFEKYLVSRDGKLLQHYLSDTTPDDLEDSVKHALSQE